MRKTYLIDVRSPKEFAYSHIPNALNFPVLRDWQYQEVGTLYHQNTFEAKRLGSAYICENIAHYLRDEKIFHPKHKLILYCARGGQRSKSFALILSQIGFDCERIEGGYKQYRQNVLAALSLPPKQRFITLYGLTGSGKTQIIQHCAWSLDIEKLAGHYGSSFGDMANAFLGQPSSAMFENRLYESLCAKEEILLVEGESKKLGKIVLPTAFFKAYQQGFSVWIESSLEQRAERIVALYGQLETKQFLGAMECIRPYLSKCFFQEALQEWGKGEYMKVALILLEKYYDRVYRRKKCDICLELGDLGVVLKSLEELREALASKAQECRSPSQTTSKSI